jgi:hypothetical protein
MTLHGLRNNPRVNQPAYVHVRVMEVSVIWHQWQEWPEVRLLIRIEPEQAEIGGHLLQAVIPSTPEAHYPREKFTDCFGVDIEQAEQVEGRWAAVRLVPAEDEDERYSVVQFVRQSAVSEQRSAELDAREARDALPYWFFEF